jgi:hypothetical protein
MNPWDGNNAPTNEWEFGGGMNDDNGHEGTNILGKNNMIGKGLPSQKLDGNVSLEKAYNTTARGLPHTSPTSMVEKIMEQTFCHILLA